MKRVVHLKDTIFTKDNLTIKNRKTGFDTQIIIRAHNADIDGKPFSIKTYTNQTSLPGRTKILEDMFDVGVNIKQHIFINDNILGSFDPVTGEPSHPLTAYNEPANILPRSDMNFFRKRKVQYWCAGNGAMNMTVINSSYDSHSTDTRLFNMIPFRIIPVDQSLPDVQRRQYKMEVVYPETSPYYGYKGYYFKKIVFEEEKIGINMTVDGVEYTPSWADSVPNLDDDTPAGYRENAFKGGKVQQNYIDLGMNIDSVEFKEWFQLIDGSLGNATISEIGLVCGLDCVKGQGINQIVEDLNPEAADYETKKMYSEIYDAELFAHLTFDPYTVARDNATLDFKYRIFA